MSNGTIVMVFHTSKEPPFAYYLILLLILWKFHSVFDHTPPLCLPQLLSDTHPSPSTPLSVLLYFLFGRHYLTADFLALWLLQHPSIPSSVKSLSLRCKCCVSTGVGGGWWLGALQPQPVAFCVLPSCGSLPWVLPAAKWSFLDEEWELHLCVGIKISI